MRADSIEALFNTAPDELSDEDAERITDYFRKERETILASPEAKGKKPPKKVADLNLKLEDLDL